MKNVIIFRIHMFFLTVFDPFNVKEGKPFATFHIYFLIFLIKIAMYLNNNALDSLQQRVNMLWKCFYFCLQIKFCSMLQQIVFSMEECRSDLERKKNVYKSKGL